MGARRFKALALVSESRYYRRYFEDPKDRTRTVNGFSSVLNLIMGGGQLLLGIFVFSPWYIVNAAYNLLMALAKGHALKQDRAAREISAEDRRFAFELAVYRRGGWFICLMGVSYLGICLWMFFTGESRVQDHFVMVLAVATLAFVKIGLAIHGIISNRRMKAPIYRYFKQISFLNGMVSMVVTQCTLLSSMDSGEMAVRSSAIFGMAVSGLFLMTGIWAAAGGFWISRGRVP